MHPISPRNLTHSMGSIASYRCYLSNYLLCGTNAIFFLLLVSLIKPVFAADTQTVGRYIDVSVKGAA